MFEWNITFSAIVTIAVALIGFISSGAVNAIAVGRYFGAADKRLDTLDRRLENLDAEAKKMTDILITVAQQKTEIHLLSRRLDDVQEHGSHRLAEVLEAIRGQIMSDFKERFEYLQKQIERGLDRE